jgi:hypothetical protein
MDPQTSNWDIWIVDVARGSLSRVTYDGAQDSDPIWSPDEKSLGFASTRGGTLALYRKTIGSVQPEDPAPLQDRAMVLLEGLGPFSGDLHRRTAVIGIAITTLVMSSRVTWTCLEDASARSVAIEIASTLCAVSRPLAQGLLVVFRKLQITLVV